MWLMTKRGFYSTVAFHGNAKKKRKTNEVLIRTRSELDLQRLCELEPMAKYRDKVVTTPKFDYPYRIRAKKADWMAAVVLLAEEIDYSNFKSAVHTTERGHHRGATYMRVWSALHRIEDEEREPEDGPTGEQMWFDCTCPTDLRKPSNPDCPVHGNREKVV